MTESIGDNARAQLKSYVDRISRMFDERDEVLDGINEVRAEARTNGYDVKALNGVVRKLRQDQQKRQEEEALLELYMEAVEG